jgi:hypothetical protein
MRMKFAARIAAAAVASTFLVAGPADARRVAIDLGDFNFEFFGEQWDNPVKFDVRGDSCFGGGACVAQNMPFAIDYGTGLVSSIFIYENGFVTFGSAVDPTRLDYGSLSGFGTDVIAPGYGDLISDQPDPSPSYPFDSGEVSYTVGDADFTGPAYDVNEIAFNSIFNVTWNNLLAGVDGPDSFKRYQFQIQFLDATKFDPNAVTGDFDLSFNFGTTLPSGVISGFRLGELELTIDPKSVLGRQNQDFVYSFRSGQLVASTNGAIPEPQTWLMMVVGVGMLGSALRHDRRRRLRIA